MSSMIMFAANNEFFRKRKRVHRACEGCKKRRKRCSHVFDEADQPEGAKEAGAGNNAPTIKSTSSSGLGSDSVTSADPLLDGATAALRVDAVGSLAKLKDGELSEGPVDDGTSTPPRWIGYMSPEAVLRGQARGRQGKDASLDQNNIGHWIRSGDEGRDLTEAEVPTIQGGQSRAAEPRSAKANAIANALQGYLNALGVDIVPPRVNQEALIDIFFTFLQPILPIVDQTDFMTRYRDGHESRILLQAICIVAAKHDRARSHLYLGDDENLLKPRTFAKRLYPCVIAAIEAKLETDRMVLIQVLALLNLHCEGFDGAEEASMHLVQAIHHAHTFGLQFGWRRVNRREDYTENLFWCLWSLDRLNATINGRPSVIHERDNSIESLTIKPEKRKTAFGIWLQLAEALDKVIVYYRPNIKNEETGWELGFPSFEEIIGEVGDNMDPPILAALELFYHAVAMVSHKSHSINDPVRATASYVRQSLSAVRVISILSTESPDDLPPLPIVPYALSLAMSVAYRHFRQSKLERHKNRGKEDMKTCCMLLDKLRTSWWSAGAMADLGKAALSKADRKMEAKAESPAAGPGLDSVSRVQRASMTPHYQGPSYIPPASQNNLAGQPTNGSVTLSPNGNTVPYPRMAGNGTGGQYQSPEVIAGLVLPGQHPVSSERGNQLSEHSAAAIESGFEVEDLTESPDWLNFDNAFENIDTLLGSSGADLSNELLKPFNHEGLDFWNPGT